MEEGLYETAEAITWFFHIMGGLGLFFTGSGVFWFTSFYKGKNDKGDMFLRLEYSSIRPITSVDLHYGVSARFCG